MSQVRAAVSKLLGRRPPVEALLLIPIAYIFLIGVYRELPYVYHADEFKTFNTTVGMLDRHSLNPEFFRYPSLMFYIHMVVLAPFDLFGDVDPMSRTALGSAYASTPEFVWLLRSVTALFALVGVALAMSMAKRVAGSVVGAVVAAAMLGLSPMVIEHSRYLATDTYAATFATGAVAASLLVLWRGRPRDYVLAGALVGLSGGAKYNVVVVAIAVVVAHALRAPDADRAEPPDTRRGWLARERAQGMLSWGRLRWLVTAGAVSMVAFVASTPYALLSFDAWWTDVSFEMRHYSTGHRGFAASSPFHYLSLAWDTYGIALALVIVALVRRETRRAVMVIASFVLGYTAFVSQYPLRFDRTILPVLPGLAALVGIGVANVWLAVRERPRGLKVVARAMAIAMLALGLSTAWPDVKRQTQHLSRDERTAAREWLADIEPGSRVLVTSYAPWIDPTKHAITEFDTPVDRRGNAIAPEVYARDYDYIVLAEGGIGRYYRNANKQPKFAAAVAAFEALKAAFPTAARFNEFGIEIIVLDLRGGVTAP